MDRPRGCFVMPTHLPPRASTFLFCDYAPLFCLPISPGWALLRYRRGKAAVAQERRPGRKMGRAFCHTAPGLGGTRSGGAPCNGPAGRPRWRHLTPGRAVCADLDRRRTLCGRARRRCAWGLPWRGRGPRPGPAARRTRGCGWAFSGCGAPWGAGSQARNAGPVFSSGRRSRGGCPSPDRRGRCRALRRAQKTRTRNFRFRGHHHGTWRCSFPLDLSAKQKSAPPFPTGAGFSTCR